MDASDPNAYAHVHCQIIQKPDVVGCIVRQGVPNPEIKTAERKGSEEQPGTAAAPSSSSSVRQRTYERVIECVEEALGVDGTGGVCEGW